MIREIDFDMLVGSNIKIRLENNCLILVGANGSGKTRFIDRLYERLLDISENKKVNIIEKNKKDIKDCLFYLETNSKDVRSINVKDRVKRLEKEIDEAQKNKVVIDDELKFSEDYKNKRIVLRKFEATRQSNIKESKSIDSLFNLKNNELKRKVSIDSGGDLESYLASLEVYASLALTKEKDSAKAERVQNVIKNIIENLRELFEDDSLDLIFDSEHNRHFIKQEGRERYSFQSLSSGYSSLLSVYADLLIKTELSEITPGNLSGIVLIDEIDAHLHLSLQRKVLPFFMRSFPKIQFIVSTHSPFVVTSIESSLIYDLSKKEVVNDVSMYSYDAVIEGLFGVSSISVLVQEKINSIYSQLESEFTDYQLIEKTINEIEKSGNNLDEEVAYFLEKAKSGLFKTKKGGSHV